MGTSIDQLLAELQCDDEKRRIEALQWVAQELDAEAAARVLPDVRRLTTDPDPAIRYHARLALDDLGRRGVLPREAPAQDEKAILELLANADVESRLKGALGAYTVRSPALFAALTTLLRKEPDPWVRASLVKAVAGYRRRVSLPLLARFLSDVDGRVRANTVEALAEFDNPVLLSRVAEMVDDPEHRVQSAVLTALGRMGGGDIRPRIEAMLASDRVWLQASAVYVLQQLTPPWTREVLTAACENSIRERRLRERVAYLIEVLDRRAANPAGDQPGDPLAQPTPQVVLESDEETVRTRQPATDDD